MSWKNLTKNSLTAAIEQNSNRKAFLYETSWPSLIQPRASKTKMNFLFHVKEKLYLAKWKSAPSPISLEVKSLWWLKKSELTICKTITVWKMSKYGVISGPYVPVFGLHREIYSVNLCFQSKYRKIRTRNNSVLGHFVRSAFGACCSLININEDRSSTVKGPVPANELRWLWSAIKFISLDFQRETFLINENHIAKKEYYMHWKPAVPLNFTPHPPHSLLICLAKLIYYSVYCGLDLGYFLYHLE